MLKWIIKRSKLYRKAISRRDAALRDRDRALIERDLSQAQLAAVQQQPSEVPAKVTLFETLYDPASGGWLIPPQFEITDPLTADRVAQWRAQCLSAYPRLISYAPVELETARFYHWFVRMTRPDLILETGTAYGYSTSMLAAALRAYNTNGRIYSIDLVATRHLFADTELQSNITFVQGSSLEYCPEPSQQFDLLVLDSDHSYGTIMQEIIRFEPALRTGGVMLLHDSIFFDGVGLAVRAVSANPRFEVVTFPTPRRHLRNTRCPGITVIRKLSNDAAAYPLSFDPDLADIEANAPGRDDHAPPLVDALERGPRSPACLGVKPQLAAGHVSSPDSLTHPSAGGG